jgi:uncharacterized damage-inducible protein DinB
MPGLVTPVADEREGLLAYLAQQRYLLRTSTYAISDEQARRTPCASSLSLGGLVKHCAHMERNWIDTVLQRRREHSGEDHAAQFRLGDDETLAGVIELYEQVALETEAAIGAIADLAQEVPVPKGVPWFPADLGAWSVRWVLLHLIEETARHAGHADIVREALDGATALPLMAAVEGWPATGRIRPWRVENE